MNVLTGCQKLRRCLAAFFVAAFGSSAFAGEIAITIDDLPYVMPSRTTPDEGVAIVQSVNAALAEHAIEAVGFVVGRQVKGSEVALQEFVDAGHLIGNHTWSHADYNEISLRAFKREVRRADRVLFDWDGAQKWFRFPYLHEGASEKSKARADKVLSDLGYVNVPVTIDNDEWKYNADYLEALDAGDTHRASEIAESYLKHMQERSLYFQTLAQQKLGRDVNHILLLHMNKINADHLDALLNWYAEQGWQFITLNDALSDPLYALPDLYAGPRGLSQIERVFPAR